MKYVETEVNDSFLSPKLWVNAWLVIYELTFIYKQWT